MFFWIILASLMGFLMFGTWGEKSKDQEFFVEPVYESLALNMVQFHNAAVYGYEDALKVGYAADLAGATNPVRNYILSPDALDGIFPLATVQIVDGEAKITGGLDDTDTPNVFTPYIQKYLPFAYKPQNNTRSYLFCLSTQSESALCESAAIRYVITFRQIPPRYDGADRMLSLNAISKASKGSRNIGIIGKAPQPLQCSDDSDCASKNIYHQPIGAHYYIMSGGSAIPTFSYLPDYFICKAPLQNQALGMSSSPVLITELENKNYLVALTIMSGLEHNTNLESGLGIGDCNLDGGGAEDGG